MTKNQKRERSRERYYARKILAEQERKCSFCDEIDYLEVDHIDGDSTNREETNLRYLCSTHHAMFHSPPKYNENQVKKFGHIIPTRLFCKTLGKNVICTSLKCASKRHCTGVIL